MVAPTASVSLFGLATSELVDQVVPLGEFWPMSEVDALTNVGALSRTMTQRIARAGGTTGIALGATRAIRNYEGRCRSLIWLAPTDLRDRASRGINEFRSFAGCSPRLFFQPRGEHASHIKLDIRGRPSEWLQRRDVSPD